MKMLEIKMKMIIKRKKNNRTHGRMHGGTGGRTERGHAKQQHGAVMLWGPFCGRNLLCLLSRKNGNNSTACEKRIYTFDRPAGAIFFVEPRAGAKQCGGGWRAGAGACLPTFELSGRGASQNEAQKGNNINKQGWRTNGRTHGRTEGGRAGQGFFTVYALAG